MEGVFADSPQKLSPVFVYDGVEEFAVPPVAGEVVAAETLVALHHPLRPQQQTLLGGHVVRLPVHLNVGDLRGEGAGQMGMCH